MKISEIDGTPVVIVLTSAERNSFKAGLRRIYREDLKPLDQKGIERLFGKPDPDCCPEEAEDADTE